VGFLRSTQNRSATQEVPVNEAGDLLNVEAIDHSGLLVTSEGAFVRILEVIPPNPTIMGEEDRARTHAVFCMMAGRLSAGQSLQFYVQTRPMDLDRLLRQSRDEVERMSGPPPVKGQVFESGLGLSRWRLYGAMEGSLRQHSDFQAAVEMRSFVVVPYVPKVASGTGVGAMVREYRGKGVPVGKLNMDTVEFRRSSRESLAHTDNMRSELEALSLPTSLVNGKGVVEMLWSRFNPTRSDLAGRRSGRDVGTQILGNLDEEIDTEAAVDAALDLKEEIAQSPIDFSRHKDMVEIDQDYEQTIYSATTADATRLGWMMSAMLTRQPFTMSVYIHALDRRNERSRLKRGYRRIYSVNRSQEYRGRVPDFDRYTQEAESAQLLQEMAGTDRTGIYEVSLYQTLRSPGPNPDLAEMNESVDWCVEQMQSACDMRISRGVFEQKDLWLSGLPLGRDVADHRRRYATRNVGDFVPLVGTQCGSPEGIPFAFTDPGRTLERIDPYDRTHANQTLLINGRSGSGKTMAANVLMARCIAQGARGFILDRAGHYRVLVDLIEGARQIDIGSDQSEWAINPWDVDDLDNVSLEKISFLVSLHGVMMGTEGLSVLERSQVGAAIRQVYTNCSASGQIPRESLLREELLRRSEEHEEASGQEIMLILRSLAERLGEFCGEGSYAYLLDRETTVPLNAPLIVFDTRRCPESLLQATMFSIMEMTTRVIESHRLEADAIWGGKDAPKFAGKSVMMIDEGWHLVGRKETGEYANDLARRARHLGLFLIVMSQHMSDFATEHGKALIRNSTMQLFLSQHPDELPFVQDALQLSDEEINIISTLKTVKGSHSQMFWVNGTRGKGKVSLRVGADEYWAFTSDPLRDGPLRSAKIREHNGNVWAAIHELATSVDLSE